MAKILIYSPQPIGRAMAGSAIRCWEFANELSGSHQVVLIFNGQPEIQSEGFDCLSFQDPSCKHHFQDADVLIAQRLTVPLSLLASSHGLKVIIDAYDPSPLELLEFYKTESAAGKDKKIASEITTLAFSFKMADGILCASEKQRDLWIGFLLAQKLITPFLYDRDPSLRSFIDVVPFGISSSPPKRNGIGLREKLGIHPNDRVILWGGGIWNWFDPLTLIRAMKIIGTSRPDIKLVFMGVKPPDPSLPSMTMVHDAIQLSTKLGLTDQCVFFHHDWIPYDERQNFLLDADIGISTHFDHLETRFSFRTRILDYLWAELPIIATTGDSFADLIERHQMGSIVPYEDEEALAYSIIDLLNQKDHLLKMKQNIRAIGKQFHWKGVIEPLKKMINQMAPLPRTQKKWKTRKALMRLLINKIREKGLKASIQKAFAKS